jgi:hypothetical protein
MGGSAKIVFMRQDDKQLTSKPKASPNQDDVAELYRRAFTEFGTRALWNIKRLDNPTVAQILAITRQLRTEGDMNARRLAEQIERAARANLSSRALERRHLG